MGLFSKIKEGLKKTKQSIGFAFAQLFKKGVFGEDFYDELESILLSADVGSATTQTIIEQLREDMTRDKISSADKANQYLKEVLLANLYDEQLELTTPSVILIVGVNGVGKTTTIGKLAHNYVKQGKSVLVGGADTFRAAAGEQLDVWCSRAGVRLIKHEEGSDPASVVYDAIASAKSKNTDIVIIDTAGRLHNKKNLMEELKKINRIIEREYPQAQQVNLLVLDATTGQNAVSQVEIFDQAISIDGIVLTKLDGTAKGGVVFAIAGEKELPVYFVGVGEGIDDLMPFDAQEFVEGVI
ncbi:MAG: signal recognition particle-docking protein FtsY [Clostridia bacterium]|nr:signal recognition particle-docking protein FtsY [Clostridia bacterium]